MSSLKELVPMSMAAKRVERVAASGVGEAIAVGSNWYLGFQFGGKICTGALTKWIKKWLVKLMICLHQNSEQYIKKSPWVRGRLGERKVSGSSSTYIPRTFPENQIPGKFRRTCIMQTPPTTNHQPPNQSSEQPFKPQQSHSRTQIFFNLLLLFSAFCSQ